MSTGHCHPYDGLARSKVLVEEAHKDFRHGHHHEAGGRIVKDDWTHGSCAGEADSRLDCKVDKGCDWGPHVR